MDITNRILKLLEQTKKGDLTLEKEIGLGRSSIQGWKNQKSNPSLEAVKKIADYFNVSVDYLLGKEKPESPYVAQGMSISLDGKVKHYMLTAERLKFLEQLAKTMEEEDKKNADKK